MLIVAAVVVPLSVRVVWEGRAELELAREAHEAGHAGARIEHLGRAARWRMPLFGHDEEALQQLVELAREARDEGSGRSHTALVAYREARRAMLATRAWGVSEDQTFEQVNREIARLVAEQEERFGTDLSGRGEPEAYHQALLSSVPGPNPIRANLAALAFLAWVGSALGFVLRGLDSRGKIRGGPAVRWGLVSVATLVAWILLVRFA